MNGKPRYRTFASYLKERFGEPVRKISLHAGFTCPNRDGTLSREGCIFCQPPSFSPYAAQSIPLSRQLREGVALGRRKGVNAFMAYFQAYTNTYGSVQTLKDVYDSVLAFPEIRALAIGTRPDCVDDQILELIHSYAPRYEVWMEYGLQSMHDATLRAINRGHGVDAFLRAVEKTRQYPEIRICTHVIVGLPGEEDDEVYATAGLLTELGMDAVKIHPIHVVRGTPLARMYASGRFAPLSLEDYVRQTVGFLERLAPDMVIQRLTADCPDIDLLAPEWIRDKATVIQAIQQALAAADTWQGRKAKRMQKTE